MVHFVLMDVLISILLLGGALLILLWKKELKNKDKALVNKVGLGIGLIGFKEIINLSYQLITLSEDFFIYSLIPEIIGIILIMFSLFNYLEGMIK